MLDQSQIEWIIKAKIDGEKTNEDIARIQEVSVRRVQQLYAQYRETGTTPMLIKIATKEDVPLGVIAMTRNGTWGLDWNSLPVMAHCHLTEGGQPEFDLKRRT